MTETTRRLIFGNEAMLPWAAALALVLGALIVYLYRVERGMVRRRVGIILTVLRVVLLVVLLLVLTEPIISMKVTKPRKGVLIVMVDNSASCQIPDRERPGYEKLRIADALGRLPEGVHRSGLAASREALSAVLREGQTAARHWTNDAVYISEGGIDDAETLAKTFDARLAEAQGLRKKLSELLVALDKADQQDQPLPEDVMRDLAAVRTRLTEVNTVELDEIIRELGDEDFRDTHVIGRLGGVTDKYTRAVSRFEQELPKLDALVVRHDTQLAETVLAGLPDVVREIDDATRLDLSARFLTDANVNLVGRLKDKYKLHTVLFARRSTPFTLHVDEDDGTVSVDVAPPTLPADALYTNFSTTLQQAVTQNEGEEIGGVIVLSDGRFNHGDDPLRAAQLLGGRAGGVPIYPVVVGSHVSPRDVAVVKVAAADVVHEQDTVEAKVLVKAPGFRGSTLEAVVTEDDNEILRKTFTVPTDTDRMTVPLRFEPKGKGQHHFVVTIPAQKGEAFRNNNTRVFSVSVLDKKLKVLLVDGGPRWEYRYLKNALLRDKRLDLKYLLFDPLTASQKERERALAAFPKNRREMFAYDTIILGDVDPKLFTAVQLNDLEAFVNTRGGTMIVICGRRFMPSAYGKTPLARVLPVIPEENPETPLKGVPSEGFGLQFTAEGRRQTIFRLLPDDAANLAAWAELPKMMWYAPVKGLRRRVAEVWAYAAVPGAGADAAAEAAARPVIVRQRYGLGRVFYMGVDGTWRWRYKVADKYFHQFWGQVILWATSGRLPAGSEHIRLGTGGRFQYTDGDDVIVQVKLFSDTKTPLADQMVRATLIRKDPEQGETPVGTVSLEYLAESGEYYEGKFAQVSAGSYTIKLTVPKMSEEAAKVSAAVEVKDAPMRELVDLSADPDFMKTLAARSSGRAFALDELARLPEALRELKWKVVYPSEVPLWNHWLLLTVFCVVVTVEWVLRKLEGLL